MNRSNKSRGRRQGRQNNHIQKKIIRCRLLQRPVWEHEHCKEFKSDTSEEKNCKNCFHSF